MNFHKRGAAASIQHANRLLLFFNSTVQANNVALNALRGRSLHEKDMDVRKKYIHTSAMLFAMGALYSWQMNQDKEYAGFSMKDKIGNLHIPLPGGLPPLKLPLGYFETGGMPWAAGQALAANVMGTAEGKNIGLALGRYALGAIPGGGGVPFFPGAKQAVEWGLNKDLRTFQDIVPKGMQNKTADRQFKDDTPEIYKSIGDTTGASPEQMRHAMNGLFGMAFDNAMQLADHYANVKPGAEKSAIPFEKVPFMSALIQNPNSSEAKDEMFDMASHATAARDSMNAMKNEGRKGEEIRDYYKAHKVEIALAPMAQKFIAEMSQFNKAIKVVDNQAGNPEAKAARKKDLQRRQKEAVERMNQARQRVEKQLATAA
jgi:hypothetical protein